MELKKGSGVRWTGTDHLGEEIRYTGILAKATSSHYLIDVPGVGEMNLERTDGIFEAATVKKIKEAKAKAQAETKVKPVVKVVCKQASGSEKLYTVAGFSTLNGVRKFRVANELAGRVRVLERNGHEEIHLVELPEAMSKAAAQAWLESHGIN